MLILVENCVHNVCGSSRGSQNCNSIELRVHQGAQRLLENLLLFATGAAAFVHWYSVTVHCAIATMAVVTERCGEGCQKVTRCTVFIETQASSGRDRPLCRQRHLSNMF